MKVLNRPMFRYGGPIKEGIMSGIKEPRRRYQQAGFVDPIMDPNLMRIRQQQNQMDAGKAFENIFQNNQYGNQKPFIEPDTTMSKEEKLIKAYEPNPKNPFRPIIDYTKTVNTYIDSEGNKRNRNTGKLVRDTDISEVITEPRGGGPDMSKIPATKPDVKLPGDKDDTPPPPTKKERVNTILESLGYDRAQKNALYDAMIKAGQRISRTGLGADNLVSDVIAETSQSYDKPEKLREAANLMDTQQQLKLEQIDASKSNKTEEDFNFYVKQFGGGEEGRKKALRLITKDAQSETEAYLAAKESTGSGLDGVKAGIEWMIRDEQIGENENKGEISKKSYDNVKEFVASDEFERRGPGVYQLEGIVARIDADGSVDIIKSFGTISEKTNSWWGFGS